MGVSIKPLRSRRLAFAGVGLLSAGILAACGAGSTGPTGNVPTGDPITIGVLEDTSGAAAPTSSNAHVGTQLAIDEINNSGGILGRPVKIVTESDGALPTQSPAAVAKLISQNPVALLMQSGSAGFVTSKPLCEKTQILCFSPIDTSSAIIAPPDNTYAFIATPSSQAYGEIFSALLLKVGYTNIGLMQLQSPTVQGIIAAVLPAFRVAGIHVLADEKFAIGGSDYTAQVNRVLATKPQAVVVIGLGGQDEILALDTVYNLAPNMPRFAQSGIPAQPDLWKVMKHLDGLVALAYLSPDNPRTAALSAKVQKVQGSKFVYLSGFAAEAYDGMYMLKKAIEDAHSTDRVAIANAFMHISSYKASVGLSSYTLTFSPDKHNGSNGNCGYVIVQFKNGKPTQYPAYQPTC